MVILPVSFLPPVLFFFRSKLFSGRDVVISSKVIATLCLCPGVTGLYFFNAKSFLKLKTQYIELNKVYRQKDIRFIEVLEDVRRNRITEILLDYLNQRVVKDQKEVPRGLILLTPTNAKANDINIKKLKSATAIVNVKKKSFFVQGDLK